MALLSGLIVLLLLTLHIATGNAPGRAISLELEDGNPLAWLLILLLCLAIMVFAQRMRQNGYLVRTALFLGNLPMLLVIACTSHRSDAHGYALATMILTNILWFMVMALEFMDMNMLIVFACCLVSMPMLMAFVPGLAERAFIVCSLIALNTLYYGHLATGERPIPW